MPLVGWLRGLGIPIERKRVRQTKILRSIAFVNRDGWIPYLVDVTVEILMTEGRIHRVIISIYALKRSRSS